MGWNDQEGQVKEAELAKVLKAISALLTQRGERSGTQAWATTQKCSEPRMSKAVKTLAGTEEEWPWQLPETGWKGRDEGKTQK